LILSAVDQLRQAGEAFDEFTLALLDVLRRQLQQNDDGEENVGIDDGFEQDAGCNDPIEYGIVRVA